MENEPTKSPIVITKYNLRQAIISVAVGFVISALTVLFQFAVEWLRDLPAMAPGALVGIAKYWTSWKHNHLG